MSGDPKSGDLDSKSNDLKLEGNFGSGTPGRRLGGVEAETGGIRPQTRELGTGHYQKWEEQGRRLPGAFRGSVALATP